MVFGEAITGLAAYGVWGYNRNNYLYDRDMRQEQEFKALLYRNRQAALWREDVRDIVSLTERKMDTYLIVNAIQLASTLMLFCEGRLAPGTPQWTLYVYSVSLASAFVYLLLSLWFAMHASVVAQASACKLLTQDVRLPIPTWDDIEQMRTYGQSYEEVGLGHALRVPFTGAPKPQAKTPCPEAPEPICASSGADTTTVRPGTREPRPSTVKHQDASSSGAWSFSFATREKHHHGALGHIDVHPHFNDPWHLEQEDRDLPELEPRPPAETPHIRLVQQEAAKYESYDAFARVCMSMGTNQLLFSLVYFCLGTVAMGDRSMRAAWVAALVMVALAVVLVHLDLQLPRNEMLTAQVLMIVGPMAGSWAAGLWQFNTVYSDALTLLVLPFCYASHGLWLMWALRACAVEENRNGSLLPTKFKQLFYMDIFSGGQHDIEHEHGHTPTPLRIPEVIPSMSHLPSPVPSLGLSRSRHYAAECRKVRANVELWESEGVQELISARDRERVDRMRQELRNAIGSTAPPLTPGREPLEENMPLPPSRWLTFRHVTDGGEEVPVMFHSTSGTIRTLDPGSPSVPVHVATGEDRVMTLSMTEAELQAFVNGPHKERTAGSTRPPPGVNSKGRSALSAGLLSPCVADPCCDGSDESDDFLPDRGRARTPGFRLPATPSELDALEQEAESVEAEEQEKLMGQLPATIVSKVTGFLVIVWFAGFCMSLVEVSGIASFPVSPVRIELQAVTENVSDFDKYKSLSGDLPFLAGGSLVNADWPRQSSFVPRALSCDPSGEHVVVADDFGVFSGRLWMASMQDRENSRQLRHVAAVPRSLDDVVASEFHRAPACFAAEGQELKDIDIVCPKGQPGCKVFVLHDHGYKLTECPLHATDRSAPASLPVNQTQVQPVTWTVTGAWLRGPTEKVESVAVNDVCFDSEDSSLHIGCVVVATDSGRIVQLRRHDAAEHTLVPDWAMQERPHQVGPSALNVLPGGAVLVLWTGLSTVQALDTKNGDVIGEWQLPREKKWLTLSGSRDALYVLCEDIEGDEEDVSLWRFPVPEELSARHRSLSTLDSAEFSFNARDHGSSQASV